MSADRFIVLDAEEAFVVLAALIDEQRMIARLDPQLQVLFENRRDIGKSLSERIDAKFRAECLRLGIVIPVEEA